MKRLCFTIALVLMFVAVYAQQDERAKNILAQVSQKTSSFQSIQADFSFSMVNTILGINEKNDGNIVLKGKKYFLDIPDFGVKIFSDERTTWNYMKNGNQVTISNVGDNSDDLMDPASLLNIYEKGFNSRFVKDSTIAGKAVHIIELLPDNNNAMDVSRVNVNIDRNTMMVQSAFLYGTDGNQYVIEIKNMVTNKNFPDSDFVFDAGKFLDVEIIDLR